MIQQFTPLITLTATDYSAGDCVGTTMTYQRAPKRGEGVKIGSISIADLAGQGPALTLIFFKSAPVGGTYNDNVALALSAQDAGNVAGLVSIVAGDWKTIGSYKFCQLTGIELPVAGNSLGEIPFLVMADSAYNNATLVDLMITIGDSAQ